MSSLDLFSGKTPSANAEIVRLEKIVATRGRQLAEKDLLLEQAERDLAEKNRIIELKDKELEETKKENRLQKEEIERQRVQLDWLKRQVFGNKSARTSTLDTIDGQLCMLFANQDAAGGAREDGNSVPAEGISAGSEVSADNQPGSGLSEPDASAAAGEGTDPSQEKPDDGVIIVEEEVHEGKKVRVDSYTRNTGKTVTRKATFDEIISGLKQNPVRIPAEKDQLVCPACGEEMEHLGWKKVRTEIILKPAVYEANVYYAETLKCGNCSNDEKTLIVETNNVPPAVIPRSLASPSLIANNAIMKYGLYVPNYRLENYILTHGVRLTRQSMAYQLIYVCKNYLIVIYEWLHMELKTNRMIVNADETPGKVNHFKELVPWTDEQGNLTSKKQRKLNQAVLDQKAKESSDDGKLHQKKIYMWLYASRHGTDHPIAIYDYQPSRHGSCCENFLGKEYSGYLMVDGYSGYNGLDKATRCCCIAHFRDYWYEAIKTKQGKLDENDPAVIGFQFSNRLFQIERLVSGSPPEERSRVREAKEKPLWKWFWEWQEGIEASGGSPLQKALTFSRNHRDILENYMLDGNLPMTNVYAELQARAYATGRKNFLFHESAEGARSAAILMTLIETARANNINPELYLVQLLEHRKEYLHNPEKRAEFAPWSERMQKSCPIESKNRATEPGDK